MLYTKRTIFVSHSRVFETQDSDELPRASAEAVAQNARERLDREDMDATAVDVSPVPPRSQSSK
jgi:hypothetical protein